MSDNNRLDKIKGNWPAERLKSLPGAQGVDPEQIFQVACSADPTPQKKMLSWLLDSWSAGGLLWEDISSGKSSEIYTTLADFERLKKKIENPAQRSLMKYKTPGQLWSAIKPWRDQEIEKDETPSGKEAKRLDMDKARLESSSIVLPSGVHVCIPLSLSAAQKFSRNTRWCTAATEDNMFKSYSEKGPLMIFTLPDGTRFQGHVPIIDMSLDEISGFKVTMENYKFDKFMDAQENAEEASSKLQKYVLSDLSFMNEADDKPTQEDTEKLSPYAEDIADFITRSCIRSCRLSGDKNQLDFIGPLCLDITTHIKQTILKPTKTYTPMTEREVCPQLFYSIQGSILEEAGILKREGNHFVLDDDWGENCGKLNEYISGKLYDGYTTYPLFLSKLERETLLESFRKLKLEDDEITFILHKTGENFITRVNNNRYSQNPESVVGRLLYASMKNDLNFDRYVTQLQSRNPEFPHAHMSNPEVMRYLEKEDFEMKRDISIGVLEKIQGMYRKYGITPYGKSLTKQYLRMSMMNGTSPSQLIRQRLEETCPADITSWDTVLGHYRDALQDILAAADVSSDLVLKDDFVLDEMIERLKKSRPEASDTEVMTKIQSVVAPVLYYFDSDKLCPGYLMSRPGYTPYDIIDMVSSVSVSEGMTDDQKFCRDLLLNAPLVYGKYLSKTRGPMRDVLDDAFRFVHTSPENKVEIGGVDFPMYAVTAVELAISTLDMSSEQKELKSTIAYMSAAIANPSRDIIDTLNNISKRGHLTERDIEQYKALYMSRIEAQQNIWSALFPDLPSDTFNATLPEQRAFACKAMLRELHENIEKSIHQSRKSSPDNLCHA